MQEDAIALKQKGEKLSKREQLNIFLRSATKGAAGYLVVVGLGMTDATAAIIGVFRTPEIYAKMTETVGPYVASFGLVSFLYASAIGCATVTYYGVREAKKLIENSEREFERIAPRSGVR